MGCLRFARDCSRRRGFGRAAALCATVLALAATGCGPSGEGAETDPEKGADAEFLNAALAQELRLLDAYAVGQRLLTGRLAAVGREFGAHQQEYANAVTKAIRGLGGEAEAAPAELEVGRIGGRRDFLELVYELEGAAFAAYQEAAPRLFTDAPRTLAASLAAGHAQHRAVLRQALGARLAEAVPEAFESAEQPIEGK